MRHLAILGSTRGTDMQAIIAAIEQKRLPAKIEIVISNKSDAGILALAAKHHLNTTFIDPKNSARVDYDNAISAALRPLSIDLIVLIGYMRILSADFVREWKNKIINIHPSLLPAFAGSMDHTVHQAVLTAGVKETGCTVHYVTEEVDAGPILIQKKCAVLPSDTADTLKQRVQQLEGEALVEAILMLGKNNNESK
jgi:phosphoribosylglycinamide formyltransferase 1